MKRPPYLIDVSSSVVIQNLLSETLNEMLDIKQKYTIVPFFYPGWTTADFRNKLSFKIADSMYKIGEMLAKTKFKRFDPQTTKLSSEIISEMWMEASRVITEEIHEGFEEILYPNRIPGLKESLNKGAIISKEGGITAPPISYTEREALKIKAENMDYLDDLLRRFRNKYFSWMQEEYDLFKEQDREKILEFKPKIH